MCMHVSERLSLRPCRPAPADTPTEIGASMRGYGRAVFGDDYAPMSLKSDDGSPLFQVPIPFGADYGGVNKELYPVKPSSEYDTWVTIGTDAGNSQRVIRSDCSTMRACTPVTEDPDTPAACCSSAPQCCRPWLVRRVAVLPGRCCLRHEPGCYPDRTELLATGARPARRHAGRTDHRA